MSTETTLSFDDMPGIIPNKADMKKPLKKSLNPLTSILELEDAISVMQNQMNTLLEKVTDNVSPEFKALMESYIKKANEAEELKVNLENMRLHHEELKSEIFKVRETNRNLVHELQNAREALKNLEHEFRSLSVNFNKDEEEYKNKIQVLTAKLQEFEKKLQSSEEENKEVKKETEKTISNLILENEKLKQENHDQSFNFRQQELELITQKDNLKKELDELMGLLREQNEQSELKTKEIEYKDALINQFIKRGVADKLTMNSSDSPDKQNDKKHKKRAGFFNLG